MLKINSEIYKGVLFIRLKGHLIEDTVESLKEEITCLSNYLDNTKSVFNISELDEIDNSGIKALISSSDKLGKPLVCGINKTIEFQINNSSMFKYMKKISDELSAFKTSDI